ncbi:hypothetical protein MNBD_GAMMA16-1793, partial [hydrothermal vent metagenome]
PTCGNLDFTILPHNVALPNVVALNPENTWNQQIKIKGAPGYNASKFKFQKIEESGGSLSATWKEPRIGKVGKLDLVFTPSENFGGRETAVVKFRIWHDYDPECLSEIKETKFYDASCNGMMSVIDLSHTSIKTLSWGGQWDFWVEVNSVLGAGATTPDYSAARLDNGSLGSLSLISVESIGGSTRKRLKFTYEHNGVMAGDEDIRIAITDNNASNSDCDPVVIMKARVNAINYCQGFSAEVSQSPGSINPGDSSIITVKGIAGNNSSGQFIYRLLEGSEPHYGVLDIDNVNATNAYDFTYTHDGSNTVNPGDNLDSMTFEVVDAIHTQCKFTKTINVTRINYCGSFDVSADNVPSIGLGGAATITLRILDSVGDRFQYEIVNQLENGSITRSNDSGETSDQTFSFDYQHNGINEEGDVVTIIVRDLENGCEKTISVVISIQTVCQDFGEGVWDSALKTTFDVLPGETVQFYMRVQGSDSGQYGYRIVDAPKYGAVELIREFTSNRSSNNRVYHFKYTNDGRKFNDSVTIEIFDPENPSCVITQTFIFEVAGICDDFSLFNTKVGHYANIKAVNFGGSVRFHIRAEYASVNSNYRFEIVSPNPLEYGTMTMSIFQNKFYWLAFYYQHNGQSNNTDGEILIRVIDSVNGCEAEKSITVYMGSLCPTFEAGMEDFGGTYSVGEVTQFKAWASGGSGNFSFTVDQVIGAGDVVGSDQVVNSSRVMQNFNYTYNDIAEGRLQVTIRDIDYECVQSFSADYDFKGSIDNPSCQTLDLALNPAGSKTVRVGRSFDFVATRVLGDEDRLYQLTIVDFPTLGTITPLGSTANTQWKFKYNAPNNTLGSSTIRLQLKDMNDALCPPIELSLNLLVDDPSDTCNGNEGTGEGSVVLDNTANSDRRAIAANLKFLAGCSREESTIGYKSGGQDEAGQGANVINIDDYQIINRHDDDEKLKVYVGALHDVVDSLRYADASTKINYFKPGEHLFDLDQLRYAADWISFGNGNLPNMSEAAKGASGTLTMQQFLKNIQDGKVMQGVVRVKIGLEKGTCGADCTRNSAGEPAVPADIYGFCSADNTSGLCACAPSNRQNLTLGNHFDGISPGFELCKDENGDSIILPAKSKIMVKGSLLWDFVDAETEEPIELRKLPFLPSKLYFKVNVPIVINSGYDDDYCGGVDYTECQENQVSSNLKSCLGAANNDNISRWDAYLNSSSLAPDFIEQMIYINGLTSQAGSDPGTVIDVNPANIKFCMVPQSSRDIYKAIKGSDLTASLFSNLARADQYHLLMPSGYVKRWAEAFSTLGMTVDQWKNLDFQVKSGASSLDEAVVRDDSFQDVPVYLYSGGLVDMHHHVSISGLIYVPQALEMEAEAVSPAYQYIAGALVVRDGFYIKAKNNSITIMSAFPKNYSGAVTTNPIPKKITLSLGGTSPLSSSGSSSGNEGQDGENGSGQSGDSNSNGSGSSDNCLFCSAGDGGDDAAAAGAGARRWQQIVPTAAPALDPDGNDEQQRGY